MLALGMIAQISINNLQKHFYIIEWEQIESDFDVISIDQAKY